MLKTLPFREARPAPIVWNLGKTLVGTAILWATIFALLPWLLHQAEPLVGLDDYRFDGPAAFVAGGILFIFGSLLHLAANLAFVIYGEGTPLFLDCPRRLVMRGPYRHVRNSMSIGMLLQGLGAALFLGSPLTLVYVAIGLLIDGWLVRPWEEADLQARFGTAYAIYRRRVRCWRARLRGYDPAREANEPPLAAEWTSPPTRHVVLYDGLCKFCRAGMKRLLALARPGAIEPVDFQEPGALDRFPGISHKACMRQMYLVTPAGRVYGGFEAAVRALTTRPLLGRLAFLYYLPGVRLLLDSLYALVARHRYKLMGKLLAAGECVDGTCALHARQE